MLALTRGRSITSNEIERVVGQEFTEQKFAAMCNEIALPTTNPHYAGVSAILEYVRVRPDGIEPDWQVELLGTRSRELPLLGSGLNVFECRRRAPGLEDRNNAFVGLVAQVHGAVSAIAHRMQRRPDCYVLFTNLRLSSPSGALRRQLKRSILLGYDQTHRVDVEIIGAEGLARFSNHLPHLRTAFFEDSGLSVWYEAWRSHLRPTLFSNQVSLVGRESELADPNPRRRFHEPAYPALLPGAAVANQTVATQTQLPL